MKIKLNRNRISQKLKCIVLVLALVTLVLLAAFSSLYETRKQIKIIQHHALSEGFLHLYPYEVDCAKVKSDGIFISTTTTPSFQMNIHDPKTDLAVSRPIAEDGCWECEMIDDIQASMAAHYGSWFLDIGTNIGMWTLSIAAAGYDTFSWEPFPENYNRVCNSINKNNFLKSRVFKLAATRKPTHLKFVIPDQRNLGSVQVRKHESDESVLSAQESDTHVLSATGLPVDGWIPAFPLDRPVAIKLDVEGAEIEALMGMLEFLKLANICHFAMEVRTGLIRVHKEEFQTICTLLSLKGLTPFRRDDGRTYTEVDPTQAATWTHFKHPQVRYFDIVWKKTFQ
mmetsp:Transcript_14885/g.29732  ORF Transcript_14885/g.29732 Transcript_14885/m.29732 type:complete len:340 (-) Transcript_14885:14-1033(-)|eukprot:CAMPEP_0194313198 /NCGR_PEP_ID=MMETSP0171-20130528/10094_1 /TAXON_ID=218684 /ORGANISM="Corethron pennatum, Strain L29A3" /LENGTH=339 /DNA_ID=CAMNT_0039068047 /DNA_START=104 /DNA_END=1123 /DNA_ORIENTATION=-